MEEIDLTKKPFRNDRQELRSDVVSLFLKEKPGTGNGERASRYRYYVRRLKEGKRIYLSRPAQLNNGFDFTLNVENTNFNSGLKWDDGKPKKSSTRPTHNHILSDLKIKKTENPKLFAQLIEQVELIYKCQEPARMDFPFKSGYSCELILECIKWLFVEQDITYWNYSGRAMFYQAIKKI